LILSTTVKKYGFVRKMAKAGYPKSSALNGKIGGYQFSDTSTWKKINGSKLKNAQNSTHHLDGSYHLRSPYVLLGPELLIDTLMVFVAVEYENTNRLMWYINLRNPTQ
jgi:hypothetical protein